MPLTCLAVGRYVANMLTAPAAGTYVFLHFLRPGRWVVPLATPPAGCSWVGSVLDYWTMSNTTFPAKVTARQVTTKAAVRHTRMCLS